MIPSCKIFGMSHKKHVWITDIIFKVNIVRSFATTYINYNGIFVTHHIFDINETVGCNLGKGKTWFEYEHTAAGWNQWSEPR